MLNYADRSVCSKNGNHKSDIKNKASNSDCDT